MLPGGYVNAYAQGLNDNGRVVGWCDAMMGTERGFLYSNGAMTDLGTLGLLPTGGYGEAYSVNRTGEAVGTASLTDTTINHAVWFSGGTKKDLGALAGPGYNSTAVGINDADQIVAYGQFDGGIYHAFWLAPANGLTPVTISNAVFAGGSFSFSFATQSGRTYACQYATVLLPGNTWLTFTSVSGKGLVARVTDPTATNAQRYYRVVAQ